MARKPRAGKREPFNATDRRLLEMLGDYNLVQRSVLCTFARIGVGWRRAEPARTRAWIEQLEPHPIYKGGQFLFDLLEIEDFMLDGPAPPPVSRDELARIAQHVVEWTGIDLPFTAIAVALETLPALEPGFYLYRDCVLGLVYVLGSGLEQAG